MVKIYSAEQPFGCIQSIGSSKLRIFGPEMQIIGR